MDIENSASLFELLCAFNFAYVLSDSFNKSLNDRILSSFTTVQENAKNVESQIQVEKESVIGMKEIRTEGLDSENALTTIKSKIKSFETEYTVLIQKIEQTIRDSSITRVFSYACLFAAFYCLFMLLLIAFKSEIPVPIYPEVAFSFSGLSLLFMIGCLLFERICKTTNPPKEKLWAFCWVKIRKWKLNYSKTLFIFFLIVIICVSYLPIAYTMERHCNQDLWMYIGLLSLTVPSIHFMYYFINATKRAHANGRMLNAELKDLENRFQEFQKNTIERFRIFHEDIKLYTVPQSENSASGSGN